MLVLTVPSQEYFDEDKSEFYVVPGGTLVLEHSLRALAKWEAKWHKPFLSRQEKTGEEIMDYIRCMARNDPNPMLFSALTTKQFEAIGAYINDPHTGTTIKHQRGGVPSETPTAEIIMYWLASLNIQNPEVWDWHLNRLMTFIEVCSLKNAAPKKLSKSEAYARNRALNERNKKLMHARVK